MTPHRALLACTIAALATLCVTPASASSGDPQLRTDHPWYPGELACSTFPRLQATQAEVYRRVVGLPAAAPLSDEQKAVASWLWRNTHYWHGEEGAEDLWGEGWGKGRDTRSREYWTGLFAHGFGLCGTTHSQWVPEMSALFGHGRGRGVGTAGHNSFEVFLTGGLYGAGKWVLLDHDLSTLVYNDAGNALLSIREVMPDWKRLTDRRHRPEKQNGWLVSGLAEGDGAVYADYNTAEYLAGYAGPPPIVHLRRGETLRRYLEPGLADGKTFVFWGRNYRTGTIPGPERSQTWVNQPERMFHSKDGAGYRPGQARYANAVYTYQPDFGTTDYREGVVDESDRHVTLEFVTPYIIGATPNNNSDWGIYSPGARNGLVLTGKAPSSVAVSVSVDRGRTWKDAGGFRPGLDLSDHVKGYRLDRRAIESDAAEALLQVRPRDMRWKKSGVPVAPNARVSVPERWTEDREARNRFVGRLRALNTRGGYPAIPTYAIALGSRQGERSPGDLFHLWLPFGREWTLPLETRDRQPGSLLPANIRKRLEQRKPLGVGGAYLRSAPTFIPTESALDAGPEEKPPLGVIP